MYVIRRVFHIWGLGDSGISAWLLPISVAICAIVMAVLFNVLKNKVKKA